MQRGVIRAAGAAHEPRHLRVRRVWRRAPQGFGHAGFPVGSGRQPAREASMALMESRSLSFATMPA